MEDYKEIMEDLLLRYYSPVEGKKIYKSTKDLHVMFLGVIPYTPITEHDVFEVMRDANFQMEQKIITEKKMIFKGDEEEGIPAEYDNVEIGRVFL